MTQNDQVHLCHFVSFYCEDKVFGTGADADAGAPDAQAGGDV